MSNRADIITPSERKIVCGTTEPGKLLVVDLVSHYGGTHRVMTNLLPLLARQFNVSVVDPYGNEKYKQALKQKGLDVSDLGLAIRRTYVGGKRTWKRPFLFLLALPRLLRIRSRLARAIKRSDPQFVYTNQQSTLRLLGWISQVRKRRLVYHAHGFSSERGVHRMTVNLLNSSNAIVIPVSEVTAGFLRKAGVNSKLIHVCYNGVDMAEVERSADAGTSASLPAKPPGQVVFLLPATVQHGKGQHLAIEALARVRSEGTDVALWLAGGVATGGDQTYRPGLQTMARKLGVSQHVHFLGWRDDVFAVIATADVVMLCSLYASESFGMVLAEAMTLRKPCIGPEVGGVPEVIDNEKTGLLFAPRDVEALAEAMMRLATDESLRGRFGRAGRERVEKLFTVERQATCIIGAMGAPAEENLGRPRRNSASCA